MKNEKGITLVELLVAVAIFGIVTVPILMLITGTFSRTIIQGKESRINYYAQEVIEEARVSTYPSGLSILYGTCTEDCSPIDLQKNTASLINLTNKDAMYSITFKPLDPSITNTKLRDHFYEIIVTVETNDTPSHSIELTTVVKRQ
jgi:prepilin-type N-terminal cleavage/methylation domain-containing protein